MRSTFWLLVAAPLELDKARIRLFQIRPQRPRAVGEADGELKGRQSNPTHSSRISAEGGNAGRMGGVVVLHG